LHLVGSACGTGRALLWDTIRTSEDHSNGFVWECAKFCDDGTDATSSWAAVKCTVPYYLRRWVESAFVSLRNEAIWLENSKTFLRNEDIWLEEIEAFKIQFHPTIANADMQAQHNGLLTTGRRRLFAMGRTFQILYATVPVGLRQSLLP
jgi:hypothetical protein